MCVVSCVCCCWLLLLTYPNADFIWNANRNCVRFSSVIANTVVSPDADGEQTTTTEKRNCAVPSRKFLSWILENAICVRLYVLDDGCVVCMIPLGICGAAVQRRVLCNSAELRDVHLHKMEDSGKCKSHIYETRRMRDANDNVDDDDKNNKNINSMYTMIFRCVALTWMLTETFGRNRNPIHITWSFRNAHMWAKTTHVSVVKPDAAPPLSLSLLRHVGRATETTRIRKIHSFRIYWARLLRLPPLPVAAIEKSISGALNCRRSTSNSDKHHFSIFSPRNNKTIS